MTETQRPRDLKKALELVACYTHMAEEWLENAAELAEDTPDKAKEIRALKEELNRLTARIPEVSR